MFWTKIADTAMTSREADMCMANITGEDFQGDRSFLSTLRALLADRLPEDDTINLTFEQRYICGYGRTTARQFCPSDSRCEIKITCMLENNDRLSDTWIHDFADEFRSLYPDYRFIDKITAFYKRNFDVLCFVNDVTRIVEIFVYKLMLRQLHHLQCSIPVFLPWYFDGDNKITEDEMRLLNSLREKTESVYLNEIAKVAQKYDFKTQRIRRLLSGFEARCDKAEYDRMSKQLEQDMKTIEALNNQIKSVLDEKREHELTLLGLMNRISSRSDSELMEYFLCSRELNLISAENNTLSFSVNTYAEYFDEDMAETMIENERSYVYNYSGISAEDMRRLMNAIFIDRELKLKLSAQYKLNLKGYAAGVENSSNLPEDYMPNPHINNHACMGTYQYMVNKLMADGNYIGAIEQCAASAKSLNFGDAVVMDELMRALNDASKECIELPGGEGVSVKKAIQFLKEDENEQDN